MSGVRRARKIYLVVSLIACAAIVSACSNGRGSVGAEAQTNSASFTVSGAVSGLAGSGLMLQLNGAGDLPVSANGAFSFTGGLANGAAYDVTIRTQPSNPAQTCAVSSGAGRINGGNVTNVAVVCTTGSTSFTVGGTVTGLTGTGLILRNNDAESLPISADGEFIFPTAVATGASYRVTITASPTTPPQTCNVQNGEGVMGTTDVTSIRVVCSEQAFTVGGTVSGLTGAGLRLRNAANGEILAIADNGAFAFRTAVAVGATYDVRIDVPPQRQNCTVANGVGAMETENVVDVAVTCATDRYTVGGRITNLAPNTQLVLHLEAGADSIDDTIITNGPFAFSRALASGAGYSVRVVTHPSNPTQVCAVGNPSGIVGTTNVDNITVDCVTQSYTVGGQVRGLAGAGLVLRRNGGEDLPIASDGAFTFPAQLSGSRYEITVRTNPTDPWQTCSVGNGDGVVGGANVTNVDVACATNQYLIRGTVTGLAANDTSNQNSVALTNGGDNLTVQSNGGFQFSRRVASGGTYDVRVLTHPSNPTQSCSVANGAGSVSGGDVTTVAVSCVTSSFTVGGSVSGLQGSGLQLLNNGGDTLDVAAGMSIFTFNTPLPSGSAYDVTVARQPSTPTQICSVAGGAGVVGGGNVTSVQITCQRTEFTVGGQVSDLAGSGLTLQNNGGAPHAIAANGPFTMPGSLGNGATYNVAVVAQPTNPSQTCSVAQGSGTINNADVTNVAVTCVTSTYTVGGAVTGATLPVRLQLNGGPDHFVDNGPFTFPTLVPSGSSYSVAAFGTFQNCTVTNGAGTIGAGNVTDVSIVCL